MATQYVVRRVPVEHVRLLDGCVPCCYGVYEVMPDRTKQLIADFVSVQAADEYAMIRNRFK